MSEYERRKFPFKFEPLLPEETAKMKKLYYVSYEFVRLKPGGFIYSDRYKNDAENIYNMPIASDDVIVYSFPRSGTTLTQEMVWLIKNDLDYKAARATPLSKRYTFLEFSALFNSDSTATDQMGKYKYYMKPGSELLDSSQSPRYIKTHLPLSFLPPTTLDTAKVIYLARNPRDIIVSCYYQKKLFKGSEFLGDFKTFWEMFLNNMVLWCPYFEHVKAAWALRHHPNMLFLFYEDICKNLSATVRRVGDFLGKQMSEDQVASLSDHLKFENFKKNDSVNASEWTDVMNSSISFIRQGKIGGWREYFDEQMNERTERWIADNLRGTDLCFPHIEQ